MRMIFKPDPFAVSPPTPWQTVTISPIRRKGAAPLTATFTTTGPMATPTADDRAICMSLILWDPQHAKDFTALYRMLHPRRPRRTPLRMIVKHPALDAIGVTGPMVLREATTGLLEARSIQNGRKRRSVPRAPTRIVAKIIFAECRATTQDD